MLLFDLFSLSCLNICIALFFELFGDQDDIFVIRLFNSLGSGIISAVLIDCFIKLFTGLKDSLNFCKSFYLFSYNGLLSIIEYS